MKILLACQTATNKGDRAIAEYIIGRLAEQGHDVVLSTTCPELWNGLKDNTVRIIEMGYRSIYQNVKNPFIKRVMCAISRRTLDKVLFADLISKKGTHLLCKCISKTFIAAVKEADLVIVTGGHHITSIREKNALFQFTYDIGLISLYAKRYILWSQTIGPLNFTSKNAKSFIENIIRKAERVYVRDENSQSCLEEIYGRFDNLIKTYDSVFGYGSMDFPDMSNRQKKIGISIFDGLKKAFKTYDAIAEVLDEYASKGYTVEFFRMEHNDYELASIQQIITLMNCKENIVIHPFMTTTEEHLREVATCQCFIGYKTHSVIMALTTATPLVAIAYHEKTIDFMNAFGVGEYALFDEDLNEENLKKCISLLNDNLDQIHQKQRNQAKRIAQQLKNDVYEMINNG